ncbi:AbrB/MazE/SpoVT family DNA-binding domain-containing protein [Thermodesulfobacteriota bacterium]
MTTLIRIGNSQGVRIPKAIIEQAKLSDKELQFRVLDDGLLIQPVQVPRKGWKERFEASAESELNENEKEWLDAPLDDVEEWEW